MSRADSTNPVFDRLFSQAVPALLGGSHQQDEPPVDGGRWPVSVVCLPDGQTREVLSDVMDEALVHAGPGHFETGRAEASHFTVRALEPYREAASVTLTVGGVMVQAEPVDDAPWELMRRLRTALGPLAWYEDQWQQRDIWYASVLHFAAPVLDAAGLVGWAEERRDSVAHDLVLDALTLTRFRYSADGVRRHMAIEPWHSAALAAPESLELMTWSST